MLPCHHVSCLQHLRLLPVIPALPVHGLWTMLCAAECCCNTSLISKVWGSRHTPSSSRTASNITLQHAPPPGLLSSAARHNPIRHGQLPSQDSTGEPQSNLAALEANLTSTLALQRQVSRPQQPRSSFKHRRPNSNRQWTLLNPPPRLSSTTAQLHLRCRGGGGLQRLAGGNGGGQPGTPHDVLMTALLPPTATTGSHQDSNSQGPPSQPHCHIM
jgi:hypothetical protein